MSPSLWQIIIVVGIFVLLFYGPKRLPGIGKSLGESIRGFKKGLNEDEEIDVTDSVEKGRIESSASTESTTASTKKEKEEQGS